VSLKTSLVLALSALVGTAILTATLSTPVQAQSSRQGGSQNNCINCHESLYFLHDTGNWYCIREAPMRCTDCHGGDPEASTAETAHLHRAAHPIINEDVSKCQECHPVECDERVGIFDQTAGLSPIRVAAPYTPVYSEERNGSTAAELAEQQPKYLLLLWECIPLVILAGFALFIYFMYVAHHRKSKQEQH
jgi:hypothetical protein